MDRLARLRQSLERLFPERHLYVRSGGEIRGFVLTTGKQATAASVAALVALWLGVGTAAMLLNALVSACSKAVKILRRPGHPDNLHIEVTAPDHRVKRGKDLLVC